jgi:hypothetical protein
VTLGFLAFRNVLRVLYGREDLAFILTTHGAAVMTYAATLSALCESDPSLQARLEGQDADARSLAAVGPSELFSHTRDLWKDLADDHEWDLLRKHVEQHISSTDETLALPARRMLSLALASSGKHNDRRRAIEIYRELVEADSPEPTDAINLARTLVELDQAEDAKTVLLDAIRRCSVSESDRLGDVGQAIVEAAGDKKFRDQLKAAIAERGSR